jgi:methyl-accepting chemotaxis protein
MNAQIATAAEEQGVVASDVSRSVNGIDQSSESLVGAAASLAETGSRIAMLSTDLAQAVSRFRV